MINVSMITALAATFYQPLAGAILSIQQVPQSESMFLVSVLFTHPYYLLVWYINGITSLGLSQDASTLNPFLAAAGVCSLGSHRLRALLRRTSLQKQQHFKAFRIHRLSVGAGLYHSS